MLQMSSQILKTRLLLSVVRSYGLGRASHLKSSLNVYTKRSLSYYRRIYTESKLTTSHPLVITALSIPLLKGQRIRSSSTFPTHPSLPASVPFELSRMMMPDDTNVSGNVHGGTILKLIEQAGYIVSTRHCNHTEEGEKKREKLITALVRLERMDFHKPMFVGEVAQLQAAVTYTSPRSIEATVDVWADNIITGERRLTNSAHLWYVAVPANVLEKGQQDLVTDVRPVPQIKGLTKEQMEEGKERYELQKSIRSKQNGRQGSSPSRYQDFAQGPHNAEPHSVLASQTTLANLVQPSDCTASGHLTGGSLMKMMDNAAGICAARHCMGRVVTACIDEIDFHAPITNGQMVFVTARLVYVSNKSMEVEVTTESEGLTKKRQVTNTAYFTFVSLGPDLSAQPVPPLELKSGEEKTRFQEGKKRYENRKKLRMEKLKKLTSQS